MSATRRLPVEELVAGAASGQADAQLHAEQTGVR
jgi:hypothetical protein